jgi:hypothetical protein
VEGSRGVEAKNRKGGFSSEECLNNPSRLWKWESLRSQTVISRPKGGRRYRPYTFTEHGALQAANVLRSPRAVLRKRGPQPEASFEELASHRKSFG